MLVISSREFRDNPKKYLDLADKNEQIIIQRGKEADIQEGINQYREGKTTKIDKANFDELLGL